MTDTTTCSHCGKPKPAQHELCPHCQRRSLVPSSYHRPHLLQSDAIKDEADDFMGLVLLIGGIALAVFLISRFVSC